MTRLQFVPFISILLWLGWGTLHPLIGAASSSSNTVRISFYSAEIKLYDLPEWPSTTSRLDELQTIRAYIRTVDSDILNRLRQSVENARARHRLNDWLYYQLCLATLIQAYPPFSDNQQQVILFLLLAESGYDARLMVTPSGPEVVFYVTDQIFNAYSLRFEEDTRNYLVPSTIHDRAKPDRRSTYLPYAPAPNGKAISLQLQEWPTFEGTIQQFQYQFQYGPELFETSLAIPDAAPIRAILDDYPILESKTYWRMPMSPQLESQLKDWLGPLVQELPKKEAIQLLLAFCRQSFTYQTDEEAYGRERPLYAQELFLQPTSDCEDRVALFFQLVTRWLKLPIAVVDMPDHLTTAVAFELGEGGFLNLDGQKYWFCDPTGPANPGGKTWLAPSYEKEKIKIIDHKKFTSKQQ